MKTPVKKIGRPVGRKPLLNLRVDQAMHDRLSATADAAGRTVAEETVARLTRSLDGDDLVQRILKAARGEESA